MPRLTREQRLEELRNDISQLQATIADLEVEIASIRSTLNYDPQATIQRHIRLLHDYNEVKDVAQHLMTMVADDRGVRQVEVYKDFGVDADD